MDTEHVEDKVVDLIAVRRSKKNQQMWIVKKCGSQVGELDQLKLKTIIFHDDHDDDIHMTQPVEFVAANLISAGD